MPTTTLAALGPGWCFLLFSTTHEPHRMSGKHLHLHPYTTIPGSLAQLTLRPGCLVGKEMSCLHPETWPPPSTTQFHWQILWVLRSTKFPFTCKTHLHFVISFCLHSSDVEFQWNSTKVFIAKIETRKAYCILIFSFLFLPKLPSSLCKIRGSSAGLYHLVLVTDLYLSLKPLGIILSLQFP